MSLEEALAAYLKADAELNSAIGGRIYPGFVPDGANYPSIAFQRISTTPEQALSGSVGMLTARVQFKFWGRTYAAVTLIAGLARERLMGLRGNVGDYHIKGVVLLDEGEDDRDGSDINPLFPVRQDYEVCFA